MYKPPFTITNTMLNLSISITEKLGKITSYQSLKRMPIFRKNNKIKSIHSSLAIEANSLSINQVRDVIDEKIVIGPQIEIQEVKNAYKAYGMINEFNGYNETDLLKAHSIITNLINDKSGKYRNHGDGVFDGEKVIFVAPPENMVPILMKDLFDWLKKDNETPLLIKSCIFHYEFVFIHPFGDGNGRSPRAMLNWIFRLKNLPPIYIKYPEKEEYYDALKDIDTGKGYSKLYRVFMRELIRSAMQLNKVSFDSY